MAVGGQIGADQIEDDPAGREAGRHIRGQNDFQRAPVQAQHAARRGGEVRYHQSGTDRAAHLAHKTGAIREEIGLGLQLQPVFIADQDDRAFLK